MKGYTEMSSLHYSITKENRCKLTSYIDSGRLKSLESPQNRHFGITNIIVAADICVYLYLLIFHKSINRQTPPPYPDSVPEVPVPPTFSWGLQSSWLFRSTAPSAAGY